MEKSKKHTCEPSSLDSQAWAVHFLPVSAWPCAGCRGHQDGGDKGPPRSEVSVGGHPVNM